jgi:hypothetical protein
VNPPDPIDAVVTWVDGDDPRHRAKLNRYLESIGRRPVDAAPTRFRSVGEIDYCVVSLLRHAPFLRRIHIVTDDQVPAIVERSADWGPALRDKLVVVDHRAIFAGHTDCLPTFNSLSIETLLCRTPGLAEQFVYLNDDFVLVGPVRPDDWFRDGRPVLRGRWQAPPGRRWDRRLRRWWRRLLGRPEHPARASYQEGQARAAAVAGFDDRFYALDHVPHPIRRSTLAAFLDAHPEALRENIRHRLRDPTQWVPQSLAAHLEIRSGRAVLEPDSRLLYLKPASGRAARLRRALDAAEHDPRILFACIQSLDEADAGRRQQVLGWLDRVVGRTPDPVAWGDEAGA